MYTGVKHAMSVNMPFYTPEKVANILFKLVISIVIKQLFLLFFGKPVLQAKTIFQLNGKRQSPKLFALRKYMQQKYKRQYILFVFLFLRACVCARARA